MASIKSFWARAKEPVLYTTLGALLILSVKQCDDGNKARETNKTVKSVAEQIDSIKDNTDELIADVDATLDVVKKNNKIVNRTEDKIDSLQELLQETADTILAHVDSCCDCNKKPVVKPKPKPRPVPRDTVYADKPKPQQITVDVICVKNKGIRR